MPRRRPSDHDAARVRYVTSRSRADGTFRWYWNRPGHPLQRLPDDPEARAYEAVRLNAQADQPQKDTGSFPEGTVGWLVARYKANTRRLGKAKPYTVLAKNTRANYDRFLDDLSERFGRFSLQAFTRTFAVRYFENVTPGSQGPAASVLYNLGALGYNLGKLPENPARELGVSKGRPRTQVWSPEALDAMYKACASHKEGAAVWDAMMLALYTGQRAVDVVRLGRNDIGNGIWDFVQSKTNRDMIFPVHRILSPLIDAAQEAGRDHLVASSSGRPVAKSTLEGWFREIRNTTAFTHLQFHDLRRTAATILVELGLSDEQVIAITGHTRASFQKMMSDIYVNKTGAIARQAVDKWESGSPETIRRVMPRKPVDETFPAGLVSDEESE